jgi:ribosomal protein L7Ae-like RNA K-turn-binding protein
MENKEKSQEYKEKITGLLHLARKAGKVIFGFAACERACLSGKASLILAAKDLAERQKTSIKIVAEANNVKYLEFGSKRYLGDAFKVRDVGIICVQDRNFASGIVKKFN